MKRVALQSSRFFIPLAALPIARLAKVLGKGKPRTFLVLITVFMLGGVQPASAAMLLSTLSSSCSDYGMDSNYQLAQSFDIPSSTTITTVSWKMWNGTPPSSASIRIYADNGNAPSSTLLGTLAFSSWSSPTGLFSGNVTLSSAGRYWVRFSSPYRIDPCYSYTPVTTGTSAGWATASVNSYESSNSGSTFASRGDKLSFAFAMLGTGGAQLTATTISISTPGIANYRRSVTINASLGIAGSDGKVTFFANGKKIPGCINKVTVSLTTTCSYIPSVRGSVGLSANLIPADPTFTASNSAQVAISVGTRTNLR